MNNIRKMGAFLGAGAVIFTLAGCADKNGNGQAEAPMSGNNAGGAVADNLGDTANAVSGAGSAAAGAVSNAGEAATMTPAVKTAIGNNAGLKGSNINVDTLGAKDSIALRGTVTSAAQKTLAEAVAKKAAPGYKIVNQLTMAGGKMGKM